MTHVLPNYLERSRQQLLAVREKTPVLIDPVLEEYETLHAQSRPIAEILDLLHRTQRLLKIVLSGSHDDPDFLAAFHTESEPSWKHKERLGIEAGESRALAEQLLRSSQPEKGEKIVIQSSGIAPEVVEDVARLAIERDVDFDMDFADQKERSFLLEKLDGLATPDDQPVVERLAALLEQQNVDLHDLRENGRLTKESLLELCRLNGITLPDDRLLESPMERIAALELLPYENTKKKITVFHVSDVRPNPVKMKQFMKMKKNYNERLMKGQMKYTLTLIPTEKDAVMDFLPYDDYVRLFIESCDQPWEAIRAAQYRLKEIFDLAGRIHIINTDGTDLLLEMSDHTFVNSITSKNLPGSEIFSAPNRDGVHGTMVAKGHFRIADTGGIVEDIVLSFRNGRVEDFRAKTDEQTKILAETITADDAAGEGSRHIGELGIGTNPHLRQHLVNGLLVEKISGSFHLALGSCYTYTEYDGEPVNVANGNKSAHGLHWDITAMLRGRGGKMYVDDRLVQENGRWLPAGCEVLNEGWGVIDPALQPSWWKRRYPNGYQD